MIQTRNLLVQSTEHLVQHLEDRSGDLRDRLCGILDRLHELRNISWPSCDHEAELAQVASERIDDLGSLPHQKIARPEDESGGLCLPTFGHYEAHGRALGCLADCFRIRRIILLALDEGLHVGRWAQPDGMPEPTRRVTALLRRSGWAVNKKRVERTDLNFE
jgi:hypothetical protein